MSGARLVDRVKSKPLAREETLVGEHSNPAERELIARARHGDPAGYEPIVRLHQDVAFRTAFLITRSAADAEDVTQEAFLKAYRALSSFRPDAPFRPWLLRIVANEARNRLRWNRRRRELTGLSVSGFQAEAAHQPSAGVPVPEPVDPDGTPEELALASEERGRLLAALQRLREDDRLVIGSRYLLELSEAEIAVTLGVPRGTVKSRLSRAMNRLRTQLEVSR